MPSQAQRLTVGVPNRAVLGTMRRSQWGRTVTGPTLSAPSRFQPRAGLALAGAVLPATRCRVSCAGPADALPAVPGAGQRLLSRASPVASTR